MKNTGTLEYRDIGAGQWLLHTSSGIKSLYGSIDSSLDGKRVEVVGKTAGGASAGMVSADGLLVESIRSL